MRRILQALLALAATIGVGLALERVADGPAGDGRAPTDPRFLAGLAAYERGEFRGAASQWLQLAENGLPEAQYAVAVLYAKGHGVAPDAERSLRWCRAAAEGGLALAQYDLALRHERGLGVVRNDVEAAHWYRRAAEGGLALAQARLGSFYETGRGVERNLAAAERWYRRAADQGEAEAQHRLGRLYEEGRGVLPSPLDAVAWQRKAASQGHESAREALELDTALRRFHLRRARIVDWTGPGSPVIRTPEEIRRGPAAPVPLGEDDDLVCEFQPRTNRGGNPKFRCFLMTDRPQQGGHYYDRQGNVRPEATGVAQIDVDRRPRYVLTERDADGAEVPLFTREHFRKRYVEPLEIKVKYRRLRRADIRRERDMYSEVAATRLLWALRYPTDRMYRVHSVACHRCPPDPFREVTPAEPGSYQTFEQVAVELKYRAEETVRADRQFRGGWSWGEETHRLRYGTGPEAFSEIQKAQFDGLVVLMNVIRHVSNLPYQNRLVCLEDRIQRLGSHLKLCSETVMLVHDLGSTFNKKQANSLASWREDPVWADPATCEADLRFRTDPADRSARQAYVVGHAGQRFVLGLLDQLTDEHLRAVFEAAGFERFDFTLSHWSLIDDERREKILGSWVDAFHGKIEQVRQGRCAGA